MASGNRCDSAGTQLTSWATGQGRAGVPSHIPVHPLGWEIWEGSQEAEWGRRCQTVSSPKAWDLQ